MAMDAILKVFEQEIESLKKQADGVSKKIKSLMPGPSAADILNRHVGKTAVFTVRGGAVFTGKFLEHDRYNILVETESGPVILLKHAVDSIVPTD